MVAIKTSQEIAAIIKDVFPDARIQLCYWHVLRAMRSKLKSFAATKGHLYNPQEAKVLIPDLEICWGCRPEKRPAGHRHSEACGCRGKNANYSTPGRLEPMTVAERDKVIRAMCASEMYTLCRQENWWRTWSYFWTEWYAAEKWELWARSAHALLPVLKTTMILESHWRLLKQDFLHRYNRPRMDLVVHCIVSELLPVMDRNMDAILSNNQRIHKADWRRGFKKAWIVAQSATLGTQTQHATDVHNWVCSCGKFVLSRFLLCKHLVQGKELAAPVTGDYFRNVRRIRAPPFWVLPGHVDFPTLETNTLPANGFEVQTLDDELSDIEEIVSDGELDAEPSPDELFRELKATIADFAELINKEHEVHTDGKLASRVLNTTGKSMKALLEDAKTKRLCKSMNRTWRPYDHSAGMFLNSC